MKFDDTRAGHKSRISTSSQNARSESHRRAKSGIDHQDFPHYSLLEYLKIDARPTFILDVAASEISENVFTPRHVFSNPALATSGWTYHDLLTGNDNNVDAQQFTSWLKASAGQERQPRSHLQYRHIWTAVLLDSSYMVISGVEANHEQEHSRVVPPSEIDRGQPQTNSHSTNEFEEVKREARHLTPHSHGATSDDSLYRMPFSRLPPSFATLIGLLPPSDLSNHGLHAFDRLVN